ncbi:hypothetical protein L195_g001928 [Trifolium pratense]|uniref:Uncharacterized protein n=1 Tax=Trifolium pratense TaxID=57577 RepID=A0A2K3NR10_TRIPR|nr:hypothetical protein L195_g001928 [Trifolium pratense]
MSILLRFDFEVIYKVGVDNKVADALSRHEDAAVNAMLSFPIWTQGRQLQQEVLQDPTLKSIIEAIQSDLSSKLGFVLKGEVLFYKNCLVILPKSPIILRICLKNFIPLPHEATLLTY